LNLKDIDLNNSNRFLKLLTCTPAMLLLYFFLMSDFAAFAQEKDKKKKAFDWEAQLGLATFYDNNILKYSEKYLDRFLNNEDYGRFHIDTYDDVILKPSLQIGTTFQIFKKQKSKINFSYNYSGYIVNEIKNWQFISLGFQQSFHKKASFRVYYSYVPEFYVRHFRDEDLVNYYKEVSGFGYIPETFVPFSFAKDNYGIWVQNTFFKSTRIRLSFDYAQYFHNVHYTEYDCKNLTYGFLITQSITKKIKVEAGYEFATSDAKAYDEPGETKETSNDADATFEEDGITFTISWQIPDVLKHKHSLDAGVTYDEKYYTTDHYVEEDPEHAGRMDKNLTMSFAYNFRIHKSFDLSAFYKWYGRDSGSPSWNDAYLSVEKDYKQSQVGLELTYKLKF
jgi:hypothetical protein